MIWTLLILFLIQQASAGSFPGTTTDFHVGIKTLKFTDVARTRNIDMRIWYPVDTVNPAKVLFDGPVFLPVNAIEDAPIAKAPTKFPLIILSHGSGGLGIRLSWLAEFLVRHGYIVVTLDHPGNRAQDNSPEGLMRVWERPKDVSFVLSQTLKDREFANHIDATRIGAAGHSAGGTTVLLLAGVRLDKKRLANPIPGCAGSDPYFLQLCEGMKKLNPKKYATEDVECSYRDDRIRAVASFDPGFGPSFNPESFKSAKTKILVLAAGTLHDPADELFTASLRDSLGLGSFELIKEADHMTFLTPCKPGVEVTIPDVADVCWRSVDRARLQE
ncbi:MAG: alpha/beta fold hydrolase [Pseudomonadota bacterium]